VPSLVGYIELSRINRAGLVLVYDIIMHVYSTSAEQPAPYRRENLVNIPGAVGAPLTIIEVSPFKDLRKWRDVSFVVSNSTAFEVPAIFRNDIGTLPILFMADRASAGRAARANVGSGPVCS